MKKPHKLLLALTLAFLAIAVANELAHDKPPEGKAEVLLEGREGTVRITAEIADSPEEVTKGLMFRESLGENEGMLFVFPDSAERFFWMKNTLIPLDIIFIDGNLTIRIIRHAVPCSDSCPLYSSTVPVKYVLEIRGNATIEKGINEGDSISITVPAQSI